MGENVVVDAGTGELVVVGPAAAPALRFAYSPEQAGAWMRQLQQMRRALLTGEVDYGTIPGTDRVTLYKPGAEKLLLAAGLVFTNRMLDGDEARQHLGVYYKATIYRGEQILAECDGYAGYDESRYYVSAADNETKERAYAKADRRPPRPEKMVEYKAPWNTLVKMAQKRALVGATVNALAASGLFLTEVENVDEDQGEAEARPRRPEPEQRAAPRARGDEPPPWEGRPEWQQR